MESKDFIAILYPVSIDALTSLTKVCALDPMTTNPHYIEKIHSIISKFSTNNNECHISIDLSDDQDQYENADIHIAIITKGITHNVFLNNLLVISHLPLSTPTASERPSELFQNALVDLLEQLVKERRHVK